MDFVAAQILDDILKGQYNLIHEVYVKNIGVRTYDTHTILDTAEAEKIFLDW